MDRLAPNLAVTVGHLRVLATPTTPESFSVANGFLSQQLVEARTNHGLLQIGRALLADPTSSDQARHYSLQLINSAVSSAASDVGSSATASSDTLTSLKAAVVDLLHHGSRGVVSEALFVKEKIAEIVAGMGERLWPQRWPTMMPELLTAASSRDASLELVALSLRTLALDASNVDFSSHLPAVRRSEILQGLSASFAQCLPPFLSQLQRCVGAVASAVAGAQPPPFQTNDLTPTSAAILASAILELCAALASFLPPAAVRDMQMFSAVAAVWSSTAAASSAFALEPSMPTGLTVAPPSRVLSQPLLDRLHRSVVSCLDALAGRKFEAGNDPDLAIASLECAAGVIASSASLGHTPLSQPGDAASPPTVHVGYPTWRSLVAACADVYTRHMPVALSGEVMAGSASSLRPTPTSAIACVQRFAQQLVHLLRHPSVIVRCSVLGCVSESLTSTHFNAHMPPAFTAGFRGAVAPLVVGCCEREGRFCRVPDGAIPPLTSGRKQSRDVAGSGVAISRAAATDAAALHLRLQHAVRSDDFADDDVDEYGYAFDVMRARASKCMVDVMAAAAVANGNTSADAANSNAAAVDQVCGDMAAVLLQAVQHGCSLATTAASSPPSSEDQQYMSCYGTCTCASSPYRWLDATAHALDIVIAAMPQHALGPGKPAAQHLTAACGHLIQCGTEDPLLRTRVSVCIAHFGRVIECDPGAASSLLSPMLERLFSFIECQPSPAATAAASAVGPPASQQLQLDVQYCRQRACHALVALAKAIPSTLLPALQPLSQRAVSLISSGLLTGSDAVSLYELLILVSNALGASDPTAQASFLGDVLRHAVSGLTDPSLAAAVASPASLLAWLGLLPPYPSSPAEILAKCDALLHVLHVLWAVARRCTAQEYSHAVGGAGITAAPPRGVTSTSQPHASSASIGAGNASSQHQRQHQQQCVDDLDLPTHPFASNWGTILSVVLPLVRTLHGLWAPGVIQHTMLSQSSATASSVAAAGSAAHDVQLASCHLLSLSKEESLTLLQAGRREAATATGGGGGKGRKHGGDDEDDDDPGDDDTISANGGAGAAGAAATYPVPVWSASTGRVVTAQLPMTPASLDLAGKLTAWVSRVSWHAYSLVSMSASSHLMKRTHACALTPTTTTNAALAVNYGSGGGVGPAPSEADVAAAWSRTGLYSAAVAPSAWPVLQAALSMDVLQHVPLRIHRVLLQQLVPGLVQGCPPSQAAASELGSLLAPLLTCAIDALLRTAPGQPTAEAALLATTGLDLHFGHLLPSSSSSLPSVTSSSNDREALCDKIRRDVTRSLMDVCLAILPPCEDWYGAVVSQGSSGAGNMPGHQHHVAGAAGMLASFLPSESPPSSATDGAATGQQQQQHQYGFVSLPGGIKLMTTSSSSTSGAGPVSLPVIANGVLLLSPAAPCIAKVAATCLLHQDGMTARKGSMMWQRVLPCLPGWLHALAGAPSSSEAAPQMQVGIKLWCCAASAFCTESVRVMCTGRSNSGPACGASGGVGGRGKGSSSSTSNTTAAFVGPIENELTAIITDIYCLAAFGYPSSHINVAARPSSLSTSPRQMQAGGQAVPPPPSQPPVPLGLCMSPSQGRALLSLACPDPRAVLASIISSGGGSHGGSSTGALDARLSNASSERERRGFMREALQEAAQVLSSRGANGTMSGGGDAGATAAMAGAASGRPVSNLPDRLTLIGRGASHGRGSSTVIESHALLDQPDYHGGGGGLEALFGDEGW